MKKAAFYKGNKTFEIGESEKISPGPDEVLLKVSYCGICGTDIHIYHGNMDQRVSIPQVIGHEVSAEVVQPGDDVQGFKKGDQVVVRPLKPGKQVPSDAGYTHIGKNMKFMGIDTPGGMQTFWTVPAYTLHKLPNSILLDHAAMIEPLAVACHDVRLSRIKPGEYCIVIGGGPIGILIALVAKIKGAEVLVSELNDKRLDLIKSLGIKVINPIKEDITKKVKKWSASSYADVVFEVSGSEAGAKTMTELTRVRGRIVMVAIHSEPRQVDLFQFFWKELQMFGVRVYEPEDFEEAIEIVAEERIPFEALITKKAPLDQIQKLFREIEVNPEGMKYLVKCS